MLSDESDELVHATRDFLFADAYATSLSIVGENEHPTIRDDFHTDDAVTNEYDIITRLNDRFAFCES